MSSLVSYVIYFFLGEETATLIRLADSTHTRILHRFTRSGVAYKSTVTVQGAQLEKVPAEPLGTQRLGWTTTVIINNCNNGSGKGNDDIRETRCS